MEEGSQESKRLSYMAKFKREVVQCAEKGHRRTAATFGVDKSNVQLWWKHKAARQQ
jgi:transposase-like protein